MTSPLRKHSLFHLPVETKSGQALGHIDDIELDPMTQQVLRYYVKSGHLVAALLQKELIVAAEQVLSITEEKMVVDDLVLPQADEGIASATSA
ncbi:MAG: PRC-barrel domain-containing protein [Candidatus Nomurabacteria bacterium]|nr:MAG: PRC-barrel domain-containing protein [Candidatus Nomurabacteria bacterium]